MDGFLPNIIKYLLFATNFAVFVMGCVVLGIAIFALVDGAALVDLVESSAETLNSDTTINVFTSAAIILVVVSAFVIVLTFFGCCGAIRENKCMLGTYFSVILVMFVVMIVGAVIGYSQSLDTVESELIKSMAKFVDKPTDSTPKEEKAVTQAWNTVQNDFKCCGMYFARPSNNSWLIYDKDQYPTAKEGYKVPESCCTRFGQSEIQSCRVDPFQTKYEISGCFTKFEDTLNKNKDAILAVGVTIVVIMFLNMLFAFAMCTMVR